MLVAPRTLTAEPQEERDGEPAPAGDFEQPAQEDLKPRPAFRSSATDRKSSSRLFNLHAREGLFEAHLLLR
jgi:hypothetical protein